MRWEKLGLIFEIPFRGFGEFGVSHCANPRAINIGGEIFRIFYCVRDKANRSSVFAIDFDISSLSVVNIYEEPFLIYGESDSFFSDGISIGNFYEVDGVWYLTFMGWTNREGEHWFGQIGTAELTSDFQLVIKSDRTKPMVSLDRFDPISLSYPWVVKLADDKYEMWYGSTKSWIAESNQEMIHIIRRRVSNDGFNWSEPVEEIPFEEGVAQAFSSPCVYDFGKYQRMWFSYRSGTGTAYTIGSAISFNERRWSLTLDEVTVRPSTAKSDWDSEMVEYPFVFPHKGNLYMLYNGNGYGKTGFGLAVLSEQ